MQRENVGFLVGGLLLGILLTWIVSNAIREDPISTSGQARVESSGPAGPRAPADTGRAASTEGAPPMVAEINALKQRVQLNPDDLASIVRLANVYHQVQMWDQAIQFYEMAIEIEDDDPDLMSDLGICYRSAERPDDALRLFELAQERHPDHWQSLFNIVVVIGFDLHEFDRAEEALARLAAFDPPPPELDTLREELARARTAVANDS